MADLSAQHLPEDTITEIGKIRRRAKRIGRDARELAQDAGRLEARLAQFGINLEVVQQPHNEPEDLS